MKAKRKRHDPQYKARVGLEALKGVKTIQQIAKEYEVHPTQVSDWKKTMSQGVASLFGRGRARSSDEEFERERKDLHSKIGQLAVEVDFLREKSKQLGL